MSKGYDGGTCGDAVRAALGFTEPLPLSEIVRRVREHGPWKDETIWQHMMSLVVNLPPARYHWKTTKWTEPHFPYQ